MPKYLDSTFLQYLTSDTIRPYVKNVSFVRKTNKEIVVYVTMWTLSSSHHPICSMNEIIISHSSILLCLDHIFLNLHIVL